MPTKAEIARGVLGGYARQGVARDDPRRIAAEQNAAAARIESVITKRLATAPPLRTEQIKDLVGLLTAGQR